MRCSHSTRVVCSTMGLSCRSTRARSPTNRHVRVDVLADFRGVYVNVDDLGVGGRSRSRGPRFGRQSAYPGPITRSASSIARLAYATPCIPGIPTKSTCASGNALRPRSVVMTGIWAFSGQFPQFLERPGDDDAVAGQDERPLSLVDELSGAAHLRGGVRPSPACSRAGRSSPGR